MQGGKPRWVGLENYPSPGSMTGKIYGASAVSFGTSFLVFGGYSWPNIYSSIYEFQKNKWSKKGEMLLPRHGHRSALIKTSDSWVWYPPFFLIILRFRPFITSVVLTKDLIKTDRALLRTSFSLRMEHKYSVKALSIGLYTGQKRS